MLIMRPRHPLFLGLWAAALLLAHPGPAHALDILNSFLTYSEDGYGDAAVETWGDRQPDLHYFQRPSLLPERRDHVGLLWKRENIANIKGGNWKGSQGDDQELTVRGQFEDHQQELFDRLALRFGFKQDKAQAVVRNEDRDLYSQYRSMEQTFRLAGVARLRITDLQLGLAVDDFTDLNSERTNINYGLYWRPLRRHGFGVGYNHYSDYFNLEVNSVYKGDRAYLPFGYLEELDELVLRWESERWDARIEMSRPTANRPLQRSNYRAELSWIINPAWTVRGQFKNGILRFNEFLLDYELDGERIGDVALKMRNRRWTLEGEYASTGQDRWLFGFSEQRMVSSSQGVSIGDLISQIILGGAFGTDLFYEGDVGLRAQQLQLGYRHTPDPSATFMAGLQLIQMFDESGSVAYGVLPPNAVSSPATDDEPGSQGVEILNSTVRLGVLTAGLNFDVDGWQLGYSVAQYFPITVFESGGDGGGGTGGGGGDRNLLERLGKTLHDYRGGNIHRLSLTYRF